MDEDIDDAVYIAKPPNSSQGDGIFLFKKFRDLERRMSDEAHKKYVVQKYISKIFFLFCFFFNRCQNAPPQKQLFFESFL